jgi:Ca-activated chloride channel family protein
MKNRFVVFILALLFLPAGGRTFAQSGVLISNLSGKPDPLVISLAKMSVDITIDNGRADVKVTQIFDSHSPAVTEGKYIFALPQRSSIFDFAIWEGAQRIPGVMMERRRANLIYDSIKARAADPGILQTTGDDESANGFSARVFPIDVYGTKRLELEYTEDLPVEDMTSHFSFPLKPANGETQTVGELDVKIHAVSDLPFAVVENENSPFPFSVSERGPNEFAGEFHAEAITLENDLSFDYRISAPENALSVVAYRAPEQISAYDLRDPAGANKNDDGYFQARAVFAADAGRPAPPKRVVMLLDTSLSMYGDKLKDAADAADLFLHSLTPDDQFNLVLFNDETSSFSETPLPARPENVERAMQFVRDSYLGGGTNLKKAFQNALGKASEFPDAGEKDIVLISDANPTLETASPWEIEKVFDGRNVRLFAFGLGENANVELLRTLCEKTHGYFDQARETEDISLKLKLFFEKVGTPDISAFSFAPDANLYDVYPTRANSYLGSDFSFVGRYRASRTQRFAFTASYGTEPISLFRDVDLPDFDDTHSFLPRVWARARVDALLYAMNENGEREDYIADIIRLSEKYKFVTPYTAFIAAPRALLRPRLIQPGDPVIRVKTAPSVKSVFAVLPFGETLPLKFLRPEGVWEARFLAPAWMADGTYKCRLILTDGNDASYSEEKTFAIDSRAPQVRISLEKRIFQAGETVRVKASSDSDTNRLFAKLYSARPAQLSWSAALKTNVGDLQIPADLASGKYILSVSAEDFAHNQTTEEIQIEVVGK